MAQRSVASKGYLETITWSFTDEKINNQFIENSQQVKIVNPISSDLNVLRSSLYPNLIYYLKKILIEVLKINHYLKLDLLFWKKTWSTNNNHLWSQKRRLN